MKFAPFLTFYSCFILHFPLYFTHICTHHICSILLITSSVSLWMNKWQINLNAIETKCGAFYRKCLWCCDFQSIYTNTFHPYLPPSRGVISFSTNVLDSYILTSFWYAIFSSLAIVWRRCTGCLCTERFTCTHDTPWKGFQSFLVGIFSMA